MNTDKKTLREDALRRLTDAKNQKRKCLEALEARMRKDYKEKTGQEAGTFFAL